MRILYFSDEFPPTVTGGATVVAYDIANAVFKKGHKVFAITANQDRSRAGESYIGGIKIFTLFSKYPVFLRHYLSAWNPFLAGKIKKILEEIKPDIVHAHNIHTHISYGALKIAKKSGAKVFLTVHDTMLVSCDKVYFPCGEKNFRVTAWMNMKTAGKRYNPFRNMAIKYYLRYVDKVFAISASLKNLLAQNGIKSEVLHNGIDAGAWTKPLESDIQNFKKKFGITDKRVVFFGGRLSGAKGGLQIIKTFSHVIKLLPNKDAVLVIAGRETHGKHKMEEFIKNFGVSDYVVFTGWLGREEMKTAFFVSDVCVTPSIYFDPFNLFNIEAMAAGKPVVGTCFGGTPEIVIDGQTGYIVNPLDNEDMGRKICELVSDAEKSAVFGKNGRKRVEEFFSLEKQAQKLIGWYEKK